MKLDVLDPDGKLLRLQTKTLSILTAPQLLKFVQLRGEISSEQSIDDWIASLPNQRQAIIREVFAGNPR